VCAQVATSSEKDFRGREGRGEINKTGVGVPKETNTEGAISRGQNEPFVVGVERMREGGDHPKGSR